MARLDPYAYPLPPIDYTSFGGAHDPHTKAVDDLIEEAAKLPDHVYKGAIVKFQVADGYAMYLVTSTRPLTLQFIPAWDGYSISDAYIRGLRLDDIKALVDRDRAWQRLVARKRAGASV